MLAQYCWLQAKFDSSSGTDSTTRHDEGRGVGRKGKWEHKTVKQKKSRAKTSTEFPLEDRLGLFKTKARLQTGGGCEDLRCKCQSVFARCYAVL